MRIVGLFAHPDDEVFCAGGSFARYAAVGADIVVVSATTGQAGQIRDASLATRRTLGEVRAKEFEAACAILGAREARCLSYRDGTLAELSGELQTVFEGLLRELRPDVVITFGDDGAYGHPDHVTVSRTVTAAFESVLSPTGPARLFHSHFPRSRLLLLDHLSRWLVDAQHSFKGPDDFVRALTLFAKESTTMRLADDHIDTRWVPAGTYLVEQGEPATSLHFILAGKVEAVHEDADGRVERLREMGPGEFFGELGVAARSTRTASVVALEPVTCLVFSADEPTLFEGRGEGVRLVGRAGGDSPAAGLVATTVIDVSGFVDRKVAAIAAHRTQYPIEASMFPPAMLQDMFGREYFVRVFPPVGVDTELFV